MTEGEGTFRVYIVVCGLVAAGGGGGCGDVWV